MFQMLLLELDLDKIGVYSQECCYTPKCPCADRRSSQKFGTVRLDGSYQHIHGYLVVNHLFSGHRFVQGQWMNFQLLDDIHLEVGRFYSQALQEEIRTKLYEGQGQFGFHPEAMEQSLSVPSDRSQLV